MAEKIKAEEEPSIEEILDSIRQIISEDETSDDEDVSAASEADTAFADVLADLEDDIEADDPVTIDDVLELTEHAAPELVASPSPPSPTPAPEPLPITVDLIDESLKTEPEPVVPLPVEEVPAQPKEKVSAVTDSDSILTNAAETAAFSAMAELARKTAVEHHGITLEDIVRTELKPLLRAWLDKNLPIVIERLVREELERVSKRVLED